MAKGKALYCGFDPGTWGQLVALKQCEEKETLTENAEAVFETQGILGELSQVAQVSEAWVGLMTALEGKSKDGLPGWLLKLFPPERYAIGLTGVDELARLSEAIQDGEQRPAGWPAGLRFHALLEFIHASARHGRVLLAIETRS